MNYQKEVDKQLEDWLRDCPDQSFPSNNGALYKAIYKHVSEYIKKYHNEVEKGAIFSTLKDEQCTIQQVPYLNNHGGAHVQTVINKATQLLQESSCCITPYEGYLLLFAIQLHDIGNIFGREDHEKRCSAIMSDLGSMAGEDKPERRTIIQIASVHGGLINDENKDTISTLEEDPHALMGQQVRSRFLAALLRFSDELADDSSRAFAEATEHGIIPKGHPSELCLLYSRSLHSVMVEKNKIKLRFEIESDMASKRYIKKGKKIFLLDEIYNRVLKMYTELAYCMRFMRPNFEIERIRMEIKIFPTQAITEPIRIEETLEERGYPVFYKDIYELCPRLKEWSGAAIRKKIQHFREDSR